LRRYGFFRATVIVLVAMTIFAFGLVQLASYSLDASAAAPGTLPARVPLGFGLAVYRTLDRVAPAPFVESTLAEQSLAAGDLEAAQRYALRLPASPTRDELLARAALARGETSLALEYYLAAPDVDAVQAEADKLAPGDPAAAYELERHLKDRLALLTTHPDAVAETYWHLGELANRNSWKYAVGSAIRQSWTRRGYSDFDSAVALAPLSERYVIADANQAMMLGDVARAGDLFQKAVDDDPESANALAGLGVAAVARGDRALAHAYLRRARALDPSSAMVRALERSL
jgi:tetratricopeptide (TPR) repeat protein